MQGGVKEKCSVGNQHVSASDLIARNKVMKHALYSKDRLKAKATYNEHVII